jgi:Predicted small integral membrane protein (DUF2165)
MVVGGEWFAMWQSKLWNGQEAAFRFYVTLLGVLIFVGQEDPESPSDKGLSGGDVDGSSRCLKPDLEAPCGPQPPGGSIAARTFAIKPT